MCVCNNYHICGSCIYILGKSYKILIWAERNNFIKPTFLSMFPLSSYSLYSSTHTYIYTLIWIICDIVNHHDNVFECIWLFISTAPPTLLTHIHNSIFFLVFINVELRRLLLFYTQIRSLCLIKSNASCVYYLLLYLYGIDVYTKISCDNDSKFFASIHTKYLMPMCGYIRICMLIYH